MLDVYIVGARPGTRAALLDAARADGWSGLAFGSAALALAHATREPPGCVLIEAEGDASAALRLQRRFSTRAPGAAVVLVADAAPLQAAVRAMREGAVDFLLRPFDPGELREAIGRAMRRHRAWSADAARARAASQCLERLTARERDVFRMLARGEHCRSIALLIHRSESTVRVHRSRLMRKLGLRTTVELLEFATRVPGAAAAAAAGGTVHAYNRPVIW